jgi:hypothetical protein
MGRVGSGQTKTLQLAGLGRCCGGGGVAADTSHKKYAVFFRGQKALRTHRNNENHPNS